MAVKLTSAKTTKFTHQVCKKYGMDSAYIERHHVRRWWDAKKKKWEEQHKRTDAFGVADTMAFNDNEDWWINQCATTNLSSHKKEIESEKGDTLRKWLSGNRGGRRFFLFGFRQEFPRRRPEKKIIEYVWIHRNTGRALVKRIPNARSAGAFKWKQIHPAE